MHDLYWLSMACDNGLYQVIRGLSKSTLCAPHIYVMHKVWILTNCGLLVFRVNWSNWESMVYTGNP